MGMVRVEYTPLGDLVMVVPNVPEAEIEISGADGLKLEKSQQTLDRERYEQSECVVFKYGTGVPKWLQRRAPEGSTVIVARHMATNHRVPIGRDMVEFLLVPSAGILMTKEILPVTDEEVERARAAGMLPKEEPIQ